MRSLQERAIEQILSEDRDVILAAPTAGGKTEAAFLPILSRLAEGGADEPGFAVLYISPLKALINDQYDRLRSMGDAAAIPVHRWHGDVAQNRKTAALRRPEGILLITPESLEALFARRGLEVATLFQSLSYVVVDELHAFMGSERGRQLQSLLHRVDLATRRTRPRIALSATLGDMGAAAEYLRAGGSENARILDDEGDGLSLQLELRGFIEPGAAAAAEEDGPVQAIAEHLFRWLRGRDNLVFANSRAMVEELADRLRRLSEEARVPVEFFPHHGNLSKELREQLEKALHSDRPATAVCTSTLELGIDIGSVHTVAQVDPPFTVASLRQRLGRSGRREGEDAILRLCVIESALDGDVPSTEPLRLKLVQSIAMIELLGRGWYEPPPVGALHLSTLVQQILSVIVQHGGAHARQLYEALCTSGPFGNVDSETFVALLRQLGEEEVLQQSPGDGTLLLGPIGERIANHYTFYAAFSTDEEYRLVHAGRSLGTLPIKFAIVPGMHLIFAGKRWHVLEVHARERRITVEPSPAGKVPRFPGGGGELDPDVVRMMYHLYVSETAPAYLDSVAVELLREGRRQFRELALRQRWLVDVGEKTIVFPWVGSKALNALALGLSKPDLRTEVGSVHLTVRASADEVTELFRQLLSEGAPVAEELAALVDIPLTQKHHRLLDPTLLRADYAKSHLDVPAAWRRMEEMAQSTVPQQIVESAAYE